MFNKCFNQIAFYFVLTILISGCAPLFPDNYLSPRTIQVSQNTTGSYIQPCVIPMSIEMLNSPSGHTLLEPALRPEPYRIGAYDNLNIIVWGHPDLSTVTTSSNLPGLGSISTTQGSSNPTILVESDGSIFYPYVGHVNVAGLTVTEVQKNITLRLSRYIRSPQVTVQVAKFRNRNTYILGEVKAPGIQALTDKPLTLLAAISEAGGINASSADPSHIFVVRGTYQHPYVFWLNAQTPQALMIAERFPLQENDIVYVSSAALMGLNNFLGQILPSLSTYTMARGLVK